MNLKRLAFAVMLTVAVSLASTSAMAAVEIHLSLGQKMMDSDLEPAEDQTAYGIGASFGGADWPVMIAVDLMTSSDDATSTYDIYLYSYGYADYTATYNLDVDTTEFNLGVRKFWGQKFRGYVGGGLSFIQLDASLRITDLSPIPSPARGTSITLPFTVVDDDDSATGYWLQGGVGWLFGKRFSINFDLTYTDADVDLSIVDPTNLPARGVSIPSSIEVEAGGTRAALMLGIKF